MKVIKKERLLKELINIKGKNEDQLDAIRDQGEKQLYAIKYQGEKQLDAIGKQNENKLKTIEKYKIVYLEYKINELFEIYPKSFNKQSKSLSGKNAVTENKINYKNLFYKTLLVDGTFQEIIFLKKYGTLYSLLENLLSKKTTVDSANADQISFIINLIHGYNVRSFDKKTLLDFNKG